MRYTFVLRDTTCNHHVWTLASWTRFDHVECLDCTPEAEPWRTEQTFAMWMFEMMVP